MVKPRSPKPKISVRFWVPSPFLKGVLMFNNKYRFIETSDFSYKVEKKCWYWPYWVKINDLYFLDPKTKDSAVEYFKNVYNLYGEVQQ